MKKLLFLIVGVIVIGYVGWVVVYNVNKPNESNPIAQPPASFLDAKIPHKPVSGIVHEGTAHSDSMEPTIKDGQSVKYVLMYPEVGDIIVFDTKVDLCGYAPGEEAHTLLSKRLIKIDGDKWWVEGDNKEVSCDSRYFGWLDSKSILFLGVITEIN